MEIKLALNIDEETKNVEVKNVEFTDKITLEESSSIYARSFDESSMYWSTEADINFYFLKQQELYATKLLEKRGHLFLNEVYDMLGLARSKIGQQVGWIYDKENPIGDNYVDFGLTRDSKVVKVDGVEYSILIDPNVDGYILDRLT